MKKSEFLVTVAISFLMLIPAFIFFGSITGIQLSDGMERSDNNNISSDYSRAGVLGAFDDTQDEKIESCPSDFPVIGWIDLSGRFLIVEELPEGQRASKCFESIEEAQKQGWQKEQS